MKIHKEHPGETGKIMLYNEKRSGVRLEVQFEKGTIWLTQKQIAELFKTERSVIGKHINKSSRKANCGKKAMCKKCTLQTLTSRFNFTGLTL